MGLTHFPELLLVGVLLGLSLSNRNKLRRISEVSTLPVPPPAQCRVLIHISEQAGHTKQGPFCGCVKSAWCFNDI